MGFLLCLDPLLNRRARPYQQQRNEELSMVCFDALISILKTKSHCLIIVQ